MLPLHRFALRCFALVCLSVALPHAQDTALAQSSAQKPLIVEKINESQLVKLEGNTPPAAIAQNDRGRVSPAMPMTDLILVLRRSPEQQAAFDAFVESQYDATSPNYHHWLAPEEVGEKFGPASADIATVSSWLSSHGFLVDGVSKDRMTIRFSGSAAQVEETFHTEIHNLVVKGEPHISNMTDPQIPMALEQVVLGPKALHNFVPRPLHRLGAKAMLNRETGTWQRIQNSPEEGISGNSASARPRPNLGIGVGSGTSADLFEFVTPYDFATIYNVLPLWTAGSPIDGTGQTIAIAGTSNINLSDVASFRSIFGLPASTPTVTYTGAGTAPIPCVGSAGFCTLDDQTENALDVEWSGAVAKGANVVLVFTTPTATNDAVYLSANYVIQNNIAPILNVSYGECELGLGTTGNGAYNTLWQTASTEGIAVFVASGDSGSPACDQGQSPTTPYSANFGLSVSGIASTQFNTAVGGTDFQWCNPTASANCASGSPYWGSSNSGTTGANALGYVPEVPWNDTCTTPVGIAYLKSVATFAGGGTVTNAESACNYIYNNYVAINNKYGADLSYFVNVEGGGGGASNCTTGNGSTVASCAGGYVKPSWQAGVTGIPGDGKRDIPDVSFFAASGLWNSAYMMCISAAGSCLTSTSPASPPIGQEVGGTSVASPAMAGVMALINQKAGGPQGNPNSDLYQLAGKQTYSNCKSESGTTSNGCYFNDIDTSTNAMPCTTGSPNCTVTTGGDAIGVLNGFSAGVGYDEATGLGSLNVANVVNAWPSSTGTATATVGVTASPSIISVDQTTSVTAAVTGASGTPTGKVYLTGGGYTSGSATLVSGSYTFTIPVNSLNGGSDSLTAHYSGDATYATATGTVSVTVNKLTPTVTVVANPTTVNATVTSVNVSVAVAGSGLTPTGTVQLSGGGYTSPACTLATGNCTITVPSNKLSNGSDTLTVTYSGDASYVTATGSATLTVSAYTPTVTVTPAASNIAKASSLTVLVAVTGTNGTATGSVQLSGGGYTSAVTTLTGGSATIMIPGGNLSAGTDTLTANYSGDTTYFSTTGTASVTVTVPTPTMTVTPAATSIDTGQTLNVTAAVTGSGTMPTGTVTLSGGGYTSSAQPLASGSATFAIPANSLSTGTDSLTVSYSGDSNYTAVTGSANVTVTASVFTLAATTPANVSRGSSAASSISWSTTTNYSGTVTLSSCTLNSGAPANSTADTPSCSVSSAAIAANGTGTATVTTKAATTAMLTRPAFPQRGIALAGSGALVALTVFFGIPARRRSWRVMLGMSLLLMTLGSLAACGGGGGKSNGGGGGGTSDPGTASGQYVFTVTGTGSPAVTPAPTKTFSVTVN